ncbi:MULTISPECIES: phenylalanine--tRNA ligase subunit beta [Veillonella]|uniref:phenylalanine--tRNA ligase subunit beta n=1 Tax=Veillonella TaxID=29465 RepID=UPI001D97F55A|nr:phenylalanine--tRNA ligase subunit beta [Veillonella sp.]MBS6391398.1 phenylalanine--tRNA ligase subunit beta [Veillonella sp.]MDU1128340.1 phenylalanine--tRNA ligase subunit beta [Veillonella sp.]MDU2206830.1 phenylalanine--tRNA ligase subunit beta [Veillonella sp.]MDU2208157.1 phenylalanine--tRNA ligase subunit beta [Veillonella sp.]MDU2971227.1 phenylalanine--tRNA ligase subunit beta [Veillonella sp.]
MKASLQWMNEYVPLDLNRPAQELADELTQAGIPVEEVLSMDPGLKKIYTGKIVEITKHPDADKLQVCQVQCLSEDGEEITKQIVTAATNVAVGQIVPVAYHKSRLADGTEIKKGKLRGVVSEGMFCSVAEFGISSDLVRPEEAQGIYIFPEGTPIGLDIKEALMLDDTVYEFELTANRADCFSMVGLSREFGIMTNQKALFPVIMVNENGESIEGKASVAIEAHDLCTRFTSRLVTNVTIEPSPLWMQNRLRNSGIRPINNVVDVTNYVMLELGQPMHAYDYDCVADHTLIARRAKAGETLTTLDGNERELNESMLIIADTKGPIGVAGVMGGLTSEVTDKTTNVLFEAAVFNGPSIRRTSKALGMRSEASGRFERGVNHKYTAYAIDRAAQLLQQICPSCKVSVGVIDVYPEPVEQRTVTFTAEQINDYLGTSIEKDRMVDILTKLEFGITESGDTIEALVPTWRDDVTGMPDIAEEVARIVSYDNIAPTIPVAILSSGGMTPKKALTKEVTHYLAHAGLSQIITFSFMHKDGLTNMMLPEGDSRYTAIPILNPISEEFPYMRTTLVPAVIEAAKRNIAQQNKDLWLFETANVYEPKALPLTEVPHERPMACGIMMGKVTEAAWNQAQRDTDFYDVKGVVDGLLAKLGLTQYDIQPSSESYYHPGVSAHYTVNGVTIANYGELHPQVVKNFDLSGKVYMFEIDLEAVLSITVPPFRYQSFSKFPGTSRDLAIVAPVSVTSGDIVALIKEHGGEYLESVSIFDVYEGEHIEAGYRSLAYNLQFRSMDGTLNDEDIDGAIQAIIDALATKNCKLR